MRRPVMYLAGLVLATGASLAFAGPASAAPSHPGNCFPCSYYDNDDNDGYYNSYDLDYLNSMSQNDGSSYYGINVLSGISGQGGENGGGLIGSLLG